MIRLKCSALIIALLVVTLHQLFADSKFTILQTGNFHGKEIAAIDGEKWFSLTNQEGQFLIELTEINVSHFHNAMVDKEGDSTGKRVTVKDKEAILLLSLKSKFVEGPVNTISSTPIYFSNGQKIDLDFESVRYCLQMEISNPGKSRSNSKLILTSGENKQKIAEFIAFRMSDSTYYYGDDAQPSLLWAGDLDRDGKLDFLFNLTNHYNVAKTVLFLSSNASKDQIVEEVGVFLTTGC